MTTAATDLGRWLVHGSPGNAGGPELWIDAAIMDSDGPLDADIIRAVLAHDGGGPWIGRLVRFAGEDGTYTVISRRTSRLNFGRPYYVLVRRDEGGAS